MDQFEDRLSKLGDLAEEELAALEQELVAAFDAADSAGDISTMSMIADHLDTVRGEKERRTGSAEEVAPEAPAEMAASGADAAVIDAPVVEADADAVVAEAEAVVAEAEAAIETETEAAAEVEVPAAEAPADATPEAAAETEETEAIEAEATEAEAPAAEAEITEPIEDSDDTEVEAAAETEIPTEAVEAEVTSPEAAGEADGETLTEEQEMTEELTSDDVADEHRPVDATPAVAIRAGADIPGVSAGSDLPDMDAVADVMTKRIQALRNANGGGERLAVATLVASAERDELTLGRDAQANAEKIQALLQRGPDALTAAANGWCAPRTPRYEIFGIGTTDRPVRDSLPSFSAERGGVVYTTPPKLSDVQTGNTATDSVLGTWAWVAGGTNDWRGAGGDASDFSPDLTAKPVGEVSCGAEVTVDLEAVTLQLKFTNMMARAYPELVKRNTELALVAHARFAESRLLAKMWTACDTTSTDVPSPALGVTRDALLWFRTASVSMRNRHRMSPDAVIDAWAPAWLRDAMAIDLADQAPGDNTLSTSYAEIEAYLSDANVNVTWFLDTVPGATTSQIFGSIDTFPANASIIMAAPGTFAYMDGGTLDIGVVRDSALVGTNEYIEFTETFEALAKFGVEGVKYNLPVLIVGGYASGVDTSAGVVIEAAAT